MDKYCSNGTIIVVIRNVGTDSIKISDLNFYLDGSLTTATCSGNIKTATLCNVGSGLTGTHTLKIVGPSNTEELRLTCS